VTFPEMSNLWTRLFTFREKEGRCIIERFYFTVLITSNMLRAIKNLLIKLQSIPEFIIFKKLNNEQGKY